MLYFSIFFMLKIFYSDGLRVLAVFEIDDYDSFIKPFYQSLGQHGQLQGLAIQAPASINGMLRWICYNRPPHQVIFVLGKRDTIRTVSMLGKAAGIPTLGYLKDDEDRSYQKNQDELLLVLRNSYEYTARAIIQFFQNNFWFDFLLLIDEESIYDKFYEEMLTFTGGLSWNMSILHVKQSMGRKELSERIHEKIVKDTTVVIHTGPQLAVRIFSVFREFRDIKISTFLSDKGYTHDRTLLKNYPLESMVIKPRFNLHLYDVIAESMSYLSSVSRNLTIEEALLLDSMGLCTSRERRMYGHMLYRKMTSIIYQSSLSRFQFSDDGYLVTNTFDIDKLVNINENRLWEYFGYVRESITKPIGILWPLEPMTDIRNGRVRYRIVTNPVKPFVIEDAPYLKNNKSECFPSTICIKILAKDDQETRKAISDYENGVHNINNSYEVKCCRGFAVDVLNRLAGDLDFGYILYIVRDTTYGKQQNGTWNGMVRDLMIGTAHMAIAAFSITGKRLQAIDFSYPYYFSRFTILYNEKNKQIHMFAFLEPFSGKVWSIIFITASISAICIAVFEWNSPFGLNPWGRKRKQNYTLASGLTMVFSVLFGHTVKTKSPKSWPSKFIQNFWASACIILIASYTANLAAFIAGNHNGIRFGSIFDSRVSSIFEFCDCILLSGWLQLPFTMLLINITLYVPHFRRICCYDILLTDSNIRVGVLGGSAVEAITRNISSKLFQKSQSHLMPTTNDAIQMLINGGIDAYLGDFPILDYARVKLDPSCRLRIISQAFGDDEYGIGFPKRSPLKKPVSDKIKLYHEMGYIEDLIDIHFDEKTCVYNKTTLSQQDFSLAVVHHGGLFASLCVGIVISILLLLVEHAIFKSLVPYCRSKPDDSRWKGLHVMFFSQRLHRVITSAVLVSAKESVKEMFGMVKRGDISQLFMKNTIRKNKLADLAKTKRLNRNFLDIVEKAKWINEMKNSNTMPDMTSYQDPVINLSLEDLNRNVSFTTFKTTNHRSPLHCHSRQTLNDKEGKGEGNGKSADDMYDRWYIPGRGLSNDVPSLDEKTKDTSSDERLVETTNLNRNSHDYLDNDIYYWTSGGNGLSTQSEKEDVDYEQICEETGLLSDNRTEASLNRCKHNNVSGTQFSSVPCVFQSTLYAGGEKQNGPNKSADTNIQNKLSKTNMQSKIPFVNYKNLSKEELLLLWKSSELQLNYLLDKTIQENSQLEKKLLLLQKQIKQNHE